MEKEQLIIGIDDAGRGPLIGPMALAGCLVTPSIEKYFKEIRVRDSKMLTARTREYLAKKIREKAISYHVTLTPPSEIDSRAGAGLNLNKIEAIKAAEIINKLTEKIHEPVRIVIDCPSPNRETWRQYVVEHVVNKKNLTIACEHKADKNHVAVSAASILAKSEREKEVAKITKKIGKDFGSGYPNDPKTIEFLNNHGKEHKKDGIFRETWATFQNHKKQKEQKKLGEF